MLTLELKVGKASKETVTVKNFKCEGTIYA